MSELPSKSCTAFEGHRLLWSGTLSEVALAVKAKADSGTDDAILVFDDATGRVIDLDLRGTEAEIIERLVQPPQIFAGRYRPCPDTSADAQTDKGSETRGRGRPKLGVVAREVTLLPRQWEWLATQPGGASAVLRRLVDDAKRSGETRQQRKAAQEAAYRFMTAIAGNLPHYEEATRALFAGDLSRLELQIADWPHDVRIHALRLSAGQGDDLPPS